MSSPERELCLGAICTALAPAAGSAPDANAITAATLAIWEQMSKRLAPVIGARGVAVLFDRALQVASAGFPWMTGTHTDQAGLSATLQACLAEQKPAAALAAACALLVTFTEVLATLIGDALTARLLAPVWAPPTSDQEHTA